MHALRFLSPEAALCPSFSTTRGTVFLAFEKCHCLDFLTPHNEFAWVPIFSRTHGFVAYSLYWEKTLRAAHALRERLRSSTPFPTSVEQGKKVPLFRRSASQWVGGTITKKQNPGMTELGLGIQSRQSTPKSISDFWCQKYWLGFRLFSWPSIDLWRLSWLNISYFD